MARSLRNAFQSSVENVIIIGTDCPGVNAEILATAFEKLYAFDLVLGSASYSLTSSGELLKYSKKPWTLPRN